MQRVDGIEHTRKVFRGGLSVTKASVGETPIAPEGTGLIVHQKIENPALGTTTAVHAAVTDNGSDRVVTTGITNPDVPRNITATAGGTAADVKAIQVIITGTDINDDALTETLPAFTVNTTGTVTGSKAFKTVTQIDIPAHDGNGATTAIGLGAKLGLNRPYAKDTCLLAHLNGVREGTLPTIAKSSSVIASNTATLSSALDGSDVDLYFAAE